MACDASSSTPEPPPWAFDAPPLSDGECLDGWRGGVGGLPAAFVEGYAVEKFSTPEAVVDRVAEKFGGAWSEYEPEVTSDAHLLEDGTAIGRFEMKTPSGSPGDASVRLWLRTWQGGWVIFAAATPDSCF